VESSDSRRLLKKIRLNRQDPRKLYDEKEVYRGRNANATAGIGERD